MYKSLDKKAINVMRINSAIISVIIVVISLIIGYLCLQNITDKVIITVTVIVLSLVILTCILDVFLFPSIRYKRYKYLVTDEKIEVKKGLFWIRRSIIQIKRIQKIEMSSGPIDRKFNLENINIYTAAGVVDIKFLNEKEAKKLSDEINNLLKNTLEKPNEN